jgi:hypothetical protein
MPLKPYCHSVFALLSLMALHACKPAPPAPAKASAANPALMQARFASAQNAASAQAFLQQLTDNKLPALPLPGLSADAALVQTLALADPQLAAGLQSHSGERLRAEVFAVYPMRESDLNPQLQPDLANCLSHRCQRIEIYDYARNQTVIGVGDPVERRMRSWRSDAGLQPEIPDRLKHIAIDLAIHAPEVIEALGGIQPTAEQAQMASTKTALNGTRCERSRHLCAAPTFVQGNIAVWAIVDLTDFKIAGVQWTNLGDRPDVPTPQITEQSVADLAINQIYCEKNTSIERAGWRLNYMLTASDGLRISEVAYQGKMLLNSVKLVDWHVSYSQREGFGYSDAIGCPSFSSAAVVPFAPPEISDIVENGKATGFRLSQEFRSLGWPGPCNYSYRQSYDFYRDGRFRPTAASIGAGCGNDGTYRPVLRIEPAGGGWNARAGNTQMQQEQWLDASKADAPTLSLKNADFNLRIEPGTGQFGDAGRGDFAYVYFTKKGTADEGASDLPTLGSCCNSDFHQGPEQFINAPPEPLNGAFVLWYVSQMKNDTEPGKEYCWAYNELKQGLPQAKAFPCIAGPMFRPVL